MVISILMILVVMVALMVITVEITIIITIMVISRMIMIVIIIMIIIKRFRNAGIICRDGWLRGRRGRPGTMKAKINIAVCSQYS